MVGLILVLGLGFALGCSTRWMGWRISGPQAKQLLAVPGRPAAPGARPNAANPYVGPRAKAEPPIAQGRRIRLSWAGDSRTCGRAKNRFSAS
jgi:hypothetical protein